MGNIQRLPDKQPGEERYITFDFTNGLNASSNPDAGEDLASPVVAVEIIDEADDSDMSETMLNSFNNRVSGKKAHIWIQGGEDGHVYKITCRVQAATSNQVLELDARLPVKEG
jgi:chaperonin GroEL (HSP60 family)